MNTSGDIEGTASAAVTFSAVAHRAANSELPAYVAGFGTGLVLPSHLRGGGGGETLSGTGTVQAHHPEVSGTGEVSSPSPPRPLVSPALRKVWEVVWKTAVGSSVVIAVKKFWDWFLG